MAVINLNPRNPYTQGDYESYNYSNPEAVINLAEYIFNPQKTPSQYQKFYGVPNASPECIQNSFAAIASIHNKDMKGRRKAEHFVLSFNNQKELSEIGGINGAVDVINQYCESLAVDYQLAYAAHEDKEHFHAHIIINPINYHTGKRMQKNRAFLEEQRSTVKNLVITQKLAYSSNTQN